MKNIIIAIHIFLLCSWLVPSTAQAIVDPRDTTNNRYGIHVIDDTDIVSAAPLVNSSGGQWGYVTLVIRANDRDLHKWQTIFDQLREQKLIPLVRLATTPKGNYWIEPKPDEAADWATFLNSLNWVIQNRYVILFNEPNHATEWGGEVNPAEYVKTARAFHDQLKSASPDFFILPAGFDVAADNSPGTTMSADAYWAAMYQADPAIFTLFDGWTSHSYPNPGFSGSPQATGRTSIQGYRWEMDHLRQYGVSDSIPIFITETGWIHQEGVTANPYAPSADTVADYFRTAFTQVWTDSQIVAITPFLLNYESEPFDNFSWKKPGVAEFYPQYDVVKSLKKPAGQPMQIHDSNFSNPDFPHELITSSTYSLSLHITNTGQSIWNPQDFSLFVTSTFPDNALITDPIPITKPGQTATITLHLITPPEKKFHNLSFRMQRQGEGFGQAYISEVALIPPPSLLVKAKLWIKRHNSGSDFSLLIYDQDQLVKRIDQFAIEDGVGTLSEIHDLIPHKEYRFVLLKPFYLPRQIIDTLSPEQTLLTFKRLLPFDFNNDGRFSLHDIGNIILHPRKASLFLSP